MVIPFSQSITRTCPVADPYFPETQRKPTFCQFLCENSHEIKKKFGPRVGVGVWRTLPRPSSVGNKLLWFIYFARSDLDSDPDCK